MTVLQFAFDGDTQNPHLPHNHVSNSVVYTGTHDNDTTRGWYERLPEWERDHVRRYLSCDGRDVASDMIRAAYGSVAQLAIVPMQDILSLGSEARMNCPGTSIGNWTWRFTWEQVDDGRTGWLRETTAVHGRVRTTAGDDGW
jgi:4-alpha-glucanotransferase